MCKESIPAQEPPRAKSLGGPVLIFRIFKEQKDQCGDFTGSPVVKTSPSNAGGVGSIPGRVAKVPHALRPKNQNIKQKQYCNKFNKDFKNDSHQKKIIKKQRKTSVARANE